MAITKHFGIESMLENMNAINYGVVQRFNGEAGFGLITPDDGGPDLFVDVSEVVGDGPCVLEAGQRVSYRVGGAATGALVAKLADHSLKSGLRREVGEALEAGTGVVIALYRDASQSSVERALAGSATKSIVTFAESTIASLEKEVAEVMSTVSPVITAQPEPQSIP